MKDQKIIFPDRLQLFDAGMVNGSRTFELVDDFTVFTTQGAIIIPAKFITDGASVPKIFWNIFDPFGEYFYAALLHDFLYSKSSNDKYNFTRKECDLLFKEAMYNIGVGWATREVIFRAVRAGGGRSFKQRF